MRQLLLAVMAFAASYAQAQSGRPEFGAASIRPNTSLTGSSSTRLTPGEVFIENASLRKCIALAYGISEDRESAIAGPDWLDIDRYNLQGKFPPNTSPDRVRVMLQNLLSDRFQLKLHRETKEAPVYALVIAKNGAKVEASAPGTPGTFSMNAGRLVGKGISMSAVADRFIEPPVRTGTASR